MIDNVLELGDRFTSYTHLYTFFYVIPTITQIAKIVKETENNTIKFIVMHLF